MFIKPHGVRITIYYQDKLLILKRAFSDKTDAELWDLPGGKMEIGEDTETAIRREVMEETGIDLPEISFKNFQGMFLGKLDDGRSLEIAMFSCMIDNPQVTLNHEHSDYAWIRTDELEKYTLGRILKNLEL